MEVHPLRKGVMLANMTIFEPIFIQRIKDSQLQDPYLARIMEHIVELSDFKLVNVILYFRDRLCVPNVDDFKNEIMTKAHNK